MATKKLVTFKIDESEKKQFDKMAKEKGMSLTELFRRSMRAYGGLPLEIHEALEGVSKETQLPPETILAHKIYKRIAVDAAFIKIFGKRPPGAGREYYFREGKLVTGQKLVNELMAYYEARFDDLNEKLKTSVKTGKTVQINREAMVEFQASL